MTDKQTHHVLDLLAAVIESRKGVPPESSYTARLFAKGRVKIAQKVGEEAVETALAAVAEGRRELISESADLLYHLLVLWAECRLPPGEVWDELRRRFETSGLDDKKPRQKEKTGKNKEREGSER